LILEVNGHAVTSVDDLRHDMEQITAAKPPVVNIKVMRGIHTLYLEMEPNWKN